MPILFLGDSVSPQKEKSTSEGSLSNKQKRFAGNMHVDASYDRVRVLFYKEKLKKEISG